jgi:tetratricopeptide (TPR) repeat protein
LGLSYKSDLGHAYAVAGKRQEAIKILDELKELSSQRYIRPYGFAVLYAGLGENEQAFEWLNKALEDRDPFVSNLAVEPRLNPLRSNPRFNDLLRRVGLRQ